MGDRPIKYVIMLKKDLATFPDFWPIIAKADEIGVLRQMHQYSGNPELVPRQEYRMEPVESKSLTDSQTGSSNEGAIYQVIERTQR